MLNKGMTGIEIAEDIQLPPALESACHARGYYGSVSHDVKAIYQGYMGWFDGNPSSLWQHPPKAAATRYVEVTGGQQAVIDQAKRHSDSGDPRFAAELLKHAVFADPEDKAANEALAEVYPQLGYGAENATWRSLYLTGPMSFARHRTSRLKAADTRRSMALLLSCLCRRRLARKQIDLGGRAILAGPPLTDLICHSDPGARRIALITGLRKIDLGGRISWVEANLNSGRK